MAALSLSFPSHSPLFRPLRRLNPTITATKPTRTASIRSTQIPSPPPGKVYQPFRPPPSPLQERFRSLSTADRLEVLRNRLGLWHEFAPVIPSLSQEGFTSSSIEEITGITSIEQNRLVVAAQVRESLVSSSPPAEVLAFFDLGGAELLYELRLLSAPQRAASARYIVAQGCDPKAAQQLARAIKDFPLRRGFPGWDCFSAESPADCLAFSDFRLSREAISAAEKTMILQRALEVVETEAARERISQELRKVTGGEEQGEGAGEEESFRLPVVRLRYGEIAEANSVVMMPVCDATEGAEGVAAAPVSRPEGNLGVVTAESGWRKWVVLPGWAPVMALRLGGRAVAVAFPNASSLPWKMNKSDKLEPVLVVVDKEQREVTKGDGFFLVSGEEGRLVVESGEALREKGSTEVVATVVLVVRPPKDNTDDQIADEDWD